MLLCVDGLEKPWDGINMPTSDYEGRFGELEFDDLPLAMQRLYSPDEVRRYDTSSRPTPVVAAVEANTLANEDNKLDDGPRIVRKLSLPFFRGRLVEHFDIKFKEGKVVWPRSRGKRPSSQVD